MKVIPETGHVH